MVTLCVRSLTCEGQSPDLCGWLAFLINVMSSLLMFWVPCRCSCCSSFDACVPFPPPSG